jgi:hypothetical protein
MEVRWSVPAAEDLKRICERIERDNSEAARRADPRAGQSLPSWNRNEQSCLHRVLGGKALRSGAGDRVGGRIGGGSIIHVVFRRPLGSKWFSGRSLLKTKGFRLEGRLDTSGEGGEPKKAISRRLLARLLVHSSTSVLMIARGLQEAATGDAWKGRK